MKKNYLVFCKCIDDIVKLVDCNNCPHKSADTKEFTCSYQSKKQ